MTDSNDKPLYDPKLYHHLSPDDQPSQYIRDYKDIEVNTDDLASFGKSLQDDLQQNYLPHFQKAATDLAVGDTYTQEGFVELIDAMTNHATKRQLALDHLHDHGKAVDALSAAADSIAKKYGASDAFSAARASDVKTDLTSTTNTSTINTNYTQTIQASGIQGDTYTETNTTLSGPATTPDPTQPQPTDTSAPA